jgi:hypothetical protein
MARSGADSLQSTIQSLIQSEPHPTTSPIDRRTALQVACALRSQLFFFEVEAGSGVEDSTEGVYMFFNESDDTGDLSTEESEALPTGVILTRCYSPTCTPERSCYAFTCQRKVSEPSRSKRLIVDIL